MVLLLQLLIRRLVLSGGGVDHTFGDGDGDDHGEDDDDDH